MAGQESSQPPRELDPVGGAKDVSPSLNEIRLVRLPESLEHRQHAVVVVDIDAPVVASLDQQHGYVDLVGAIGRRDLP